MSKYEDRIKRARDVALQYAMYDGAHHKQWCIDQMLRAMLGDIGYATFLDEFEAWDEGIPP